MKGYRISVIRHGRTAANDKGIYIGRTDFPLSDKGAAELAGKMDEFQYPNVARVYSSPLRRCTETAGGRSSSWLPTQIQTGLILESAVKNDAIP